MSVTIRILDNFNDRILKDAENIYREASWIADGESGDFLLPAFQGSTAVAGAFDTSGNLVGIARALSDGASDAYIQDVAVTASMRGKKIGSKLIKVIYDDLRSRGVDWIALVGEPGTEKFYASLGLEEKPGYTLWKFGDFSLKD